MNKYFPSLPLSVLAPVAYKQTTILLGIMPWIRYFSMEELVRKMNEHIPAQGKRMEGHCSSI